MIRYYCDGCACELNVTEVAAQSGQRPAQLPELFCTICAKHAEEYWTAKLAIINEMANQLDKRLLKHRRTFFKGKQDESTPDSN